jgi:four helix bundle protein
MSYQKSKLKDPRSKKAPTDNQVDGKPVECLVNEMPGLADGGSMALREESGPANGQPLRDLIERTAVFGEKIIRFAKKIPRGPDNDELIAQLVAAGTSVGANYCEASEAESKKDFRHIITRCLKEAKETRFFLRMVAAAEPPLAPEGRPLYREAHELLCIFGSMRHK